MDKTAFIYQNTKLTTFNSGGKLIEQGLGTNPRISFAGAGKSAPAITGGHTDRKKKSNFLI
jgi:hypothetical protein